MTWCTKDWPHPAVLSSICLCMAVYGARHSSSSTKRFSAVAIMLVVAGVPVGWKLRSAFKRLGNVVTRDLRLNRTCGQQPRSERGAGGLRSKVWLSAFKAKAALGAADTAETKVHSERGQGRHKESRSGFLPWFLLPKAKKGTPQKDQAYILISHLAINRLCIPMHSSSLSY